MNIGNQVNEKLKVISYLYRFTHNLHVNNRYLLDYFYNMISNHPKFISEIKIHQNLKYVSYFIYKDLFNKNNHYFF